eukprot:3376966-Rhodomonas_salina.4
MSGTERADGGMSGGGLSRPSVKSRYGPTHMLRAARHGQQQRRWSAPLCAYAPARRCPVRGDVRYWEAMSGTDMRYGAPSTDPVLIQYGASP